jgi:hypothetical protein
MTIEEIIAELSQHNPKAQVTFSVSIDTSEDPEQRWFCEDGPESIFGNAHPVQERENETVVTICLVAESNL